VLDAVLAVSVDGGRGAEGVHGGDQGEPEAPGGPAQGEAVLRRRRRRARGHRCKRVRALAARVRGGRRREHRLGGGIPGPVPVGGGVRLPRDDEAVPAGQGHAARPFHGQEGHFQVNAAEVRPGFRSSAGNKKLSMTIIDVEVLLSLW
jgi:hypothetical protein